MYDKSKRNGLLYEKVRYAQRKNKPTKKKTPNNTVTTNQAVSESEIEELVQFFESCVLPRDKRELSDKLQTSAAMRKVSNETNRNIFDKSFHLYRVDSDLVGYFMYFL